MRICGSNAKTHMSFDGSHAACGFRVDPDKVNPNGKSPVVKRFVAQGERPTCIRCLPYFTGKKKWRPRPVLKTTVREE